ncbi:MAG TPA: PD-(D/E)XK nuclease family protein [Pyrinomonadaceae bacterium]|nr:PD-(D/E)XK nuclease family protein [Pyrinomonadaceae bacterium]
MRNVKWEMGNENPEVRPLSKQLWLGPLLGTNRERLVERCAELVSKGQSSNFLYLAASQPLLEIVTQGILDGRRNQGLWGELHVYLFRGFVRRLLSTAVDENGQRVSPRVPIDQEELPLKRSLISQILRRLLGAHKLKALAPVAHQQGCVNTICSLIGEIERAAKSPAELAEIITSREQDLALHGGTVRHEGSQQLDFEKDVALVYSNYCQVLDQQGLTEADADQFRALGILSGELDGRRVQVPWLANVQLLMVDGFFDFTPVQGEILRRLIPQIPEVIVNLNHDQRNSEIFLPFQETIAQLKSIAPFEEMYTGERITTRGTLADLSVNLFNPHRPVRSTNRSVPSEVADGSVDTSLQSPEIKYFECGDRDTEIRSIAKEIKRLVTVDDYKLADIALVVRQRVSYAGTISRVMREESLPCNLESRIEATDVPGNRAVLKLLAILEEQSEEDSAPPRISELADLVKSEYFRLGQEDMNALSSRFRAEYYHLLSANGQVLDDKHADQLKSRYRIGFWDADALENAFAYVGSDLRVNAWLSRAERLIAELPSATATKQLLNIDNDEPERDRDPADELENAETARVEENDAEKKRRPSRDIHPASLAWTALVVQCLNGRIRAIPREGKPADLRLALMRLLDQLDFRQQIARPIRALNEDQDLPQVILNFNSLEAVRRAFLAAIKSVELASRLLSGPGANGGGSKFTKLATFVEEVRRSLASQTQVIGAPDRGGLRVLEATDVRGLRFRAVFIAGLVEGGFPLRASRDWIYPHEERERLKRYGLTLEDISPATLLKEEHYFYQVACRATECLYLSRPLLLEDDSETVASYYIDELRRAVAPHTIEVKTIRRDYEGKNLPEISSTSELAVALVRQEERHASGNQEQGLMPQPRIKRLLTLARNDGFLSSSAVRRIEIERERAGYLFGPYDGQITDPHLLALLNKRFGSDFVHSASGLSVYGNCPYRFFAQRVLKLEPRGEAALDLQAIDAGKLLHDILRRFFEQHRHQRLYELDREKLREELAIIADEVFDKHERVVPPLNKEIWKIDREIRKILLDQILLYELEVQQKARAEDVVPAYFEVAFGSMKSVARDPHSKDEPLELSRATFVGDETIKIRGQIDRVDQARDNTLVAYDYKLSTGSSTDDIKAGRSLQIPIYLEALEKLVLPEHPIAGGGYYVIRGGNDRRNKGLHRAAAIKYTGINERVGAVMSDDEWRQVRSEALHKIWDFLDRMRAGLFLVNPSEKEKTCRFCDFAAVCRYNRYRIEGKKKDYPQITQIKGKQ